MRILFFLPTILACGILSLAVAGKLIAPGISDGAELFRGLAIAVEIAVISAFLFKKIALGSWLMLAFAAGGIIWTLINLQTPYGCFGRLIRLDAGDRLAVLGFVGATACFNFFVMPKSETCRYSERSANPLN